MTHHQCFLLQGWGIQEWLSGPKYSLAPLEKEEKKGRAEKERVLITSVPVGCGSKVCPVFFFMSRIVLSLFLSFNMLSILERASSLAVLSFVGLTTDLPVTWIVSLQLC